MTSRGSSERKIHFGRILTDRHVADINSVVAGTTLGRTWTKNYLELSPKDDQNGAQRQTVERRGKVIYINMIVVETSQALADPLGDCVQKR